MWLTTLDAFRTFTAHIPLCKAPNFERFRHFPFLLFDGILPTHSG
jgi:hypothetical protein